MQHKRPHGHPLRCCSSACEATTVEIRVVTIGCTCMEQGGGWRRERAASPSTRAADSIARPSSLLLRVVLAMRAAAVTRWWRACGREGRDCGLTAATSARPGCAVRCGRELKSESLQYAHSRLGLRAGTCVWTHGIARQCANVSQMIQQPKVTLYPATGSPRGAVHRGPTLHTALTAQAPRGRRDPSSD